MSLADRTVSLADPDRHIAFKVTDTNGGALDFTPVVAVVGNSTSTDVTAEWLGTTETAGDTTTRDLDIPLAATGKGSYVLRLKVPGDNDLDLGSVRVR